MQRLTQLFGVQRLRWRVSTVLLAFSLVLSGLTITASQMPPTVTNQMLQPLNFLGRISGGAVWAIPAILYAFPFAAGVCSLAFVLASSLQRNLQVQFLLELTVSATVFWAIAMRGIA